ncbi:MAG: hypothetical protein GTO18_07640 [Anaerolineales bacterium]|nr:hypothetical protein [Anaerolineales bacterium]
MTKDEKGYIKRFKDFFIQVIGSLFHPEPTILSKWMQRIWLMILYLGGALVWGFFLNFGRIEFAFHDWTQEGPRYDFIRRALIEAQLPLHIGSPLASSERFLAIPDTVISPQVIMLRFLEPGAFVFFNALFLYTLGFIGLVLLRNRLKWSSVTFTIVFLIFTLNGHITAHVAVGHSMWLSYFLLSFYALLIINLLDGQSGWRWVLQMALLQLGLFLNGGFHFFIYCIFFLILLAIFSTRHLVPILKAIVFGSLLCLFRIIPTAIEFSGKDNPFISGYPSVTDMVSGFIDLKIPIATELGLTTGLGWWELDIYIGLLGFVFLILFGVFFTLKSHQNGSPYRILLAPIFVMAVLSLGKIFQPISILPLPLMDAERVASRFLIIPLVLTLVLGSYQSETYIKRNAGTIGRQLVALALIGVLAHDLLQHTRLWRVTNMANLFPYTPVDIRAEALTRSDPTYTTALLVGLLLSAASLAFLVFQSWKESKTKDEPPPVTLAKV